MNLEDKRKAARELAIRSIDCGQQYASWELALAQALRDIDTACDLAHEEAADIVVQAAIDACGCDRCCPREPPPYLGCTTETYSHRGPACVVFTVLRDCLDPEVKAAAYRAGLLDLTT